MRGIEKARRLDQWIEEWGEPVFVWAYGNDGGDRELWARADHAVRFRYARCGTAGSQIGR